MIRLREETLDYLFEDYDSKKRLRRFDNEDETESEGFTNRCLSYLINLQTTSRPKTLEKLHRTLQQFCTFSFRVDPNVIFFHLILNHIILPHEQDGTNFVSVNPHPPPRPGNQFLVAIPNCSSLNRVSSDFKEVLQKSVSWVQSNRGLQGKQIVSECFLRSLEQICTLKKKANPEVAVSHLLKRGMIRVEQEGTLVYDLPLVSTSSHYMASICK